LISLTFFHFLRAENSGWIGSVARWKRARAKVVTYYERSPDIIGSHRLEVGGMSQ
jgi:hypothetical protein